MENHHDEIGLERRSNGWGLVRIYKEKKDFTEDSLLNAWILLHEYHCDRVGLEGEIWNYAEKSHDIRVRVDSGLYGIFSKITTRTVPAKTYTTKKGETKTDSAYEETIHKTFLGEYLGTTKEMGGAPISYPIMVEVTKKMFNIARTLQRPLESCFEPKPLDELDRTIPLIHRDIPRSERKEMRALKRVIKAPSAPVEPVAKPKKKFNIQVEEPESEEEEDDE
jgi:hypothetical protein